MTKPRLSVRCLNESVQTVDSSRAVLSWLIRKNLVETSQQNGKVIPTKQVKINGGNVRCVILQMAQSEEEYDYINEII